jgi:uncharacterized protein YjbI with pentapeptide repeats
MATLAKQERLRISERTKAGLQRARKAGAVPGRPRVEVGVKKLRAMQDTGMSLRKIAGKTRLSLSTVVRSLRVLRLELPKTFIAAKLQYLSMANPEHLAKLKEGVEVWNAWRKHEPSIHIDLSGADLSGGRFGEEDPVFAKFVKEKLGHPYAIENLSEANLSKARLSRANLSSAKLAKANFAGANLLWADLQSADLAGAKFAKAHLAEADLSGANLTGAYLGAANLSSAHLTDANLNNVLLRDTQFSNVDLSSVRGLHSVRHEGPSSIGIDTLFLSQGNIPEVFLRGAGVPESFITYVKSLVGLAVGYYSLFISYSTKDQEFADRLYADLQAKGVRCWFAPHDVQGGRKLHEQIDEAIRLHDKPPTDSVVPHSMESEWVKDRDLQGTRKREVRDKARVLVPDQPWHHTRQSRDWECFDADAGKDSGREIREYFIPDFSRWKDHDGYTGHAFDRLVRRFAGSGAESRLILLDGSPNLGDLVCSFVRRPIETRVSAGTGDYSQIKSVAVSRSSFSPPTESGGTDAPMSLADELPSNLIL